MIERQLLKTLRDALKKNAAVALTGPRQVGKTTLAFDAAESAQALYLDLENPTDLLKAAELQSLHAQQRDKLIVLDEVQRMPTLFPQLRGLIDAERRAGNKTGLFLLLGSASAALLRQSGESLAGRISYLELFGVNAVEWLTTREHTLSTLWLRGGFPESLLADSDADSSQWRRDFIRSYLERDMPMLGPSIPVATMERFWRMIAHNQGSIFNAAQYARNLDVAATTVARYLDFMVDLLLVRRLQPWTFNINKRLIRATKVYVRDSGLTHSLAGVPNFPSLLGHPVMGGSWEGFVIENIMSVVGNKAQAYYYRTSNGAEIDLILEFSPTERWAIEIKYSEAPKLSKGFYIACDDIGATKRLVITSGKDSFPIGDGVQVVSLLGVLGMLGE